MAEHRHSIAIVLAIAACRPEGVVPTQDGATTSAAAHVAVPPAPPVDAREVPSAGHIEVIALGTGTGFRFKGLAIDARTETAYLGSWDRQTIMAVSLREQTRRVVRTKYDGRLNAMGMYLRGDSLYALMNEIDDAPGAKALSVLLVIAVPTLEVTRAFEIRGNPHRHHFNHVVVDGDGIAYITDTLQASIYTVDTRRPDATVALLVQHPSLGWVHGIDLIGTKLVTTSYEGGIRFYDRERAEFYSFSDRATAGDDDLKYAEGALYGVGNNTIRRYVLDAAETAVVRTEVVLRDHEQFNDPRILHIEDGWLYCLANIELEPVSFSHGHTRERPLQDSHVIKLRL